MQYGLLGDHEDSNNGNLGSSISKYIDFAFDWRNTGTLCLCYKCGEINKCQQGYGGYSSSSASSDWVIVSRLNSNLVPYTPTPIAGAPTITITTSSFVRPPLSGQTGTLSYRYTCNYTSSVNATINGNSSSAATGLSPTSSGSNSYTYNIIDKITSWKTSYTNTLKITDSQNQSAQASITCYTSTQASISASSSSTVLTIDDTDTNYVVFYYTSNTYRTTSPIEKFYTKMRLRSNYFKWRQLGRLVLY